MSSSGAQQTENGCSITHKRDLSVGALFKTLEARYRLNSLPGEVQKPRYMKLDNTNLPPQEAARRIADAFELAGSD
jgi:hypothetical protein